MERHGRSLLAILITVFCTLFLMWRQNLKNTIQSSESETELSFPQTDYPDDANPKSSDSSQKQIAGNSLQLIAFTVPLSTLKFKGKVGTKDNQLGISFEERNIGPGGIKRTQSGAFLIADSNNHRVSKLKANGELEFAISFDPEHVVQGMAETPRGELKFVRRDDRKLFLDTFDPQGRFKETLQIDSSNEFFRDYVGTFKTTYTQGKLFISNSHGVMRVGEDGKTIAVPGTPMLDRDNIYLSTEQKSDKTFVIEMKNEEGKILNSFSAHGKYESLKSIQSDKKGRIHIEFEHNFESTDADSGETITTFGGIIETYDENGQLLDENIFEKSLDVEVDRDTDIDEEGNLSRIAIGTSAYEVHGWMINDLSK